ncbi:MAG: hypothetical protein NWF00_05925 [Candidatus Bathyarchaeota archaeon]|nr:hypothetical protein [Candidatus Bathyarchaeota archaeon]
MVEKNTEKQKISPKVIWVSHGRTECSKEQIAQRSEGRAINYNVSNAKTLTGCV